MKKKLIALTLCVLTLCLCFAACGDKNAEIKKALTASKWETEVILGDNVLNSILEYYYFEPEEIAFADKSDFTFSQFYAFQDDGTALLAYDTDKIYDTLYNGMDHFLSTLYANLDKLADIYGESEFEDERDYKDFMAWFISEEEWDTAEELLDAFANEVLEYYFFDDEEGTFREMTYKVVDGVVEVYDGADQWDELTYNAEKGTLVSKVDGETFTKAG